ncbi:MAG: hypothetical protein ACT4NU_10195 [Chromatiales bacterium]
MNTELPQAGGHSFQDSFQGVDRGDQHVLTARRVEFASHPQLVIPSVSSIDHRYRMGRIAAWSAGCRQPQGLLVHCAAQHKNQTVPTCGNSSKNEEI